MAPIETKKSARFLKKIMLFAVLASGLLFKGVLHAHEGPPRTWIIDEQHVLSNKVFNGLDRILSESSQNRNIQLRVAIVRLMLNKPQDEQINQKIIDWRRTDPSYNTAKTAYFIIDLNERRSHIVLGRKNTAREKDVVRINEKIILPHLEAGALEKALSQGAIALTSVLEEWPTQPTHAKGHYLGLSLKILMGLAMMFGAWRWVSWYRQKSQKESVLFQNIGYKEDFLKED